MIDTSLFPYQNFPYRLQFGEKKDVTVCFFECSQHLDKYIERYKLDKRTIKIDYRDGEPAESGKKHKNRVEPRTTKSSGRSATGSTRSTKKLDKPGTSSRTRKPKSK